MRGRDSGGAETVAALMMRGEKSGPRGQNGVTQMGQANSTRFEMQAEWKVGRETMRLDRKIGNKKSRCRWKREDGSWSGLDTSHLQRFRRVHYPGTHHPRGPQVLQRRMRYLSVANLSAAVVAGART